MATATQVQGYLYNAQGLPITTGRLHIILQQDMVLDGQKIAPTKVVVDLSTTAGYVNVGLLPTATASPTGLAYFVEFDPDPSDTSKPISAKTGYFSNYWQIPVAASVSIGSFPVASRTSPNYAYLGVNDRALGYVANVRVVTVNTALTAADNGLEVFIEATAARTITLPPPVAGMHFSIISGGSANYAHAVSPGAGVTIKGFGTRASGVALTNSTPLVGNYVRLVALDAATWVVTGARGTWS